MHVKAKTMAFGGLLLALSVVFMALGSIIETSTLFLLAAASFVVQGKWDMSFQHLITTFCMCLGGGALGGMLA